MPPMFAKAQLTVNVCRLCRAGRKLAIRVRFGLIILACPVCDSGTGQYVAAQRP